MYDAKGFQVAKSLNRFAMGDRDKLKFNGDGSLDLFVQAESPGADKESNWLPGPKSGTMAPTLRLYLPQPEVVDGFPWRLGRRIASCRAERRSLLFRGRLLIRTSSAWTSRPASKKSSQASRW
jgi:Protein of unknown function (DUF1214)